MEDRQHIKSLKKALRTLRFLNERGDVTVSDVARAVKLPRTTAHRLLETFANEGYVQKQPHCDLYRLTSRVRDLAVGFTELHLIIEIAKPMIEAFGRKVGWPVALATPHGTDMITRIATDHDTSLAIDRFTVGFATPILYAPSGFCYLAHCDENARANIMEKSRKLTGAAAILGDGDYFSFMLNHVRSKGFCNIRFPEHLEGGVAVPLIVSGEIIGGIVMRYFKSTLNASQVQDQFVPAMRKLASDIAAVCEQHLRPANEVAPCASRRSEAS